MAMNAGQLASAQLATDWWNALILAPPMLPLFSANDGNDVADLLAGGLNAQPEYVNDPLLMQSAIRFMNTLFTGVDGHNNDVDVARLQTFDVNNVNTFGPAGELRNLQNQGLFGRMCMVDLPVDHLRTGIAANGAYIPYDTIQEQGMLLGNGMIAYIRALTNNLPGGHLAAIQYSSFFRELIILRPNFFANHPEVMQSNNLRQVQLAQQAQMAAAAQQAQAALQPNVAGGAAAGGAAAGGAAAGGAAAAGLPVAGGAAAVPGAMGGLAGGGAAALAPGALPLPAMGALLAPGVAPGAGGVGGGGMIAQFHKIVADVPPLSPAEKSNETAQLDSADAQIRAHMMFWITRLPGVTDDQRIQAYLRAITVQEVQTMLTADEQSRAAMGAAPAVRLSMLVQDLRSWMSLLLASRISHLDKGFLTRVAFHPDENLRSMVNRTSLQHQLLGSLYPAATMATFYQGHLNFDAAILEPMLSAMEQADPKYQSWINSQPARGAITWAQIKNLAMTEPYKTASRRKRVVQITPVADPEEQPVYATEGRGGPGTIAGEVIQAISPSITGIRDELSKDRESITAIGKQVQSNTEQISNLMQENMTLRRGITNRTKYGDDAFSEPAVGQTMSPAAEPSFMSKLVAAVAPSGQPQQTLKDKMQPKATRTKITMEDLEKQARPWAQLVKDLLKAANKQMHESCVICTRGNGRFPPVRPHPTEECGLLFTLISSGLAWLEAKQQTNKARYAGKVQLADTWEKLTNNLAEDHQYDSAELSAQLCQVCGDSPSDLDTFILACENKWVNCEAAVADFGSQLR